MSQVVSVEALASQLLHMMLERIDSRDHAALIDELALRMRIDPAEVELIAESPSEMFIREPFRLAIVAEQIAEDNGWSWPEFSLVRAHLEDVARPICAQSMPARSDQVPAEILAMCGYATLSEWAATLAGRLSLQHSPGARSELAYEARLHDISLLEQKAEMLETALAETIEGRAQVQKVRLGSRASVRHITPAELPNEDFRRWCEATALRTVIDRLSAAAVGSRDIADPDRVHTDSIDPLSSDHAREHLALQQLGEDDESERVVTTVAEQAAIEEAGHLWIRLDEHELEQCEPTFRDFLRRLSATQAVVVLARVHSESWEEADRKIGRKPGYSRDVARRIRRDFPEWLSADWVD